MIDIHCHILPAVDDGPEELEESIEMAAIAARDGIKTVVATPHLIDAGTPRPERIAELVDELNSALAERGIGVQVLPGADVQAHVEPSELKKRTINGKNYVLIEFPHTHLPMNAQATVFAICASGLKPIVTHPERNMSVIRDPARLFELSEAGLLVQITAESLTGAFGVDVRECAVHLLRKGAVNFIATDAHSAQRRKPVLSEGLRVAEKLLGARQAAALVSTNPEAVINGRPLNV